ncbi:MAG: hypothetical protein GY749_43800 [Desulfobacteraceae bacterium]|nr:hypothetical protein [Desulfobacteraceae bacterium]
MKAFIVTEEKTAEALRLVLPPAVTNNVKFIIGEGKYSAHSLARSVMVTDPHPLVLVLDSDTTTPSMIEEEKNFIHTSIKQLALGVKFNVIFAVPEIEALFFQDKNFIEGLIGKELTDTDWELAKNIPKKILMANGIEFGMIKTNIKEKNIESIREHPIIKEIAMFLDSVKTLQ